MFITKFMSHENIKKSMKTTQKKSKFQNTIPLIMQIHASIKIKKESILTKNWPWNNLDAKEDPYEKTIIANNREMD